MQGFSGRRCAAKHKLQSVLVQRHEEPVGTGRGHCRNQIWCLYKIIALLVLSVVFLRRMFTCLLTILQRLTTCTSYWLLIGDESSWMPTRLADRRTNVDPSPTASTVVPCGPRSLIHHNFGAPPGTLSRNHLEASKTAAIACIG